MRGDPDLDMSIDPQPYAAESQPAPVPVTPNREVVSQCIKALYTVRSTGKICWCDNSYKMVGFEHQQKCQAATNAVVAAERAVNHSAHREARLSALEKALAVSGDTEAALWDERKAIHARLAAIVQEMRAYAGDCGHGVGCAVNDGLNCNCSYREIRKWAALLVDEDAT